MKKLSNEKTFIEYNEEESKIYGGDRRDQNNDPRFYNQTKRGIKKAWEDLEKRFTPETTMSEAMDILEENKIRTRSYCAMD